MHSWRAVDVSPQWGPGAMRSELMKLLRMRIRLADAARCFALIWRHALACARLLRFYWLLVAAVAEFAVAEFYVVLALRPPVCGAF
eukprot:scaffold1459_cov104-Isochrysis_galbana.AAC.3